MMKHHYYKGHAESFKSISAPFRLKYRTNPSVTKENKIEDSIPCRRRHLKGCPICKQSIKQRIIHFLPQLYKIRRAKRPHRLNLIRKADHCLLKFLSDICFGILKKVVVFPKEVYKRLSEYEPIIYKLGHKVNLPDKTKRELLIQKDGGFLPLILPALASAVFGIIGNLIAKKING